MRALLQRCSRATVRVEGEVCGSIGPGLLVFLGIGAEEPAEHRDWLLRKIVQMRLFADEQGIMNRSLEEVQGDLLVVSQFTLMARTKKGNRPSYSDAAPPAIAEAVYEDFVARCRAHLGASRVETGRFGADMAVELVNDGPVTIWLDTDNRS